MYGFEFSDSLFISSVLSKAGPRYIRYKKEHVRPDDNTLPISSVTRQVFQPSEFESILSFSGSLTNESVLVDYISRQLEILIGQVLHSYLKEYARCVLILPATMAALLPSVVSIAGAQVQISK
jgi:hypothetical protein